MRDSTWHGVTIPAGARVALVTGSACRDEREYPDPDRFDVTRRHERELYFGHGHHVCIGKSLARLETRIALEEIARALPALRGRRVGHHAHLSDAREGLCEPADFDPALRIQVRAEAVALVLAPSQRFATREAEAGIA